VRDLDKLLDEVLLKTGDVRICGIVEKALADHCLKVVAKHKLRHLDEIIAVWKDSIDK